MESTLLHSFTRAANLRRWLSDPGSPPVFQEIKDIFDKVYTPKGFNDTVDAELDAAEDDSILSDPRYTPNDLRPLLSSSHRQVYLRARIKINNVVYSTAQTHTGNSLIYYYAHGDMKQRPTPGCIRYIYSITKKKFVFAVQRQLPDESNVRDPFSAYTHFPARLYSSELSVTLEKVEPQWIFCHYARWRYDSSRSVVLSLSRVSLINMTPVLVILIFWLQE